VNVRDGNMGDIPSTEYYEVAIETKNYRALHCEQK